MSARRSPPAVVLLAVLSGLAGLGFRAVQSPAAGPADPTPSPTPAVPAAPTPAPAGDDVNALNDQAKAALDRGDALAAVSLLERARKLAPDDPVLRANLAWAYYRRGQAALDARRDPDAIADYGRAADLDPSEPGYRVHKAQLLLREYRLVEAETELRTVAEGRGAPPAADEEAAARRAMTVADAWMLLGDALALQDRLPEAVDAYAQAEQRGDATRTAQAREARERTARQQAVEKDYRVDRTPSFTIRGPARGDGPLYGPRLAGVLDRARADVVQQLGWAPDYRITVVLYPEADFRAVTGTHEWVGGLFDRKIRLPIVDVEQDAAWIETAFRHEFTHLVVADINPSCPTWVNEGLAEVMAYGRGHGVERLVGALEQRRIPREQAPHLADLPDSFLSITDGDRVELLYIVSHAFVDQVVTRYGARVALDWIDQLERKPLAAAFQAATGRPLADEEAQFREYLRTAR